MKVGDPEAFAALQSADTRVWHATMRNYEGRRGITREKVQARLDRMLREGWTFEVYSEAKFCELMSAFVQQVRPVVIYTSA